MKPATGSRPHTSGGLRYALVYPNAYSVGMANLGFQTLYGYFGAAPDTSCERFFADREGSVESNRTAGEFDVVALSLSFEGDYPAAVDFLAGSGIPPAAIDRGGAHPLVLAGGIAPSLNPEPLAGVADVIFLGEAEAGLDRLHLFLHDNIGMDRRALLSKLAAEALPGVYVPSAYEVDEDGSGIVGRRGIDGAPAGVDVVKAPKGWAPAHSVEVAPDDAFGGAYLVEISRGCPHGCRFCAAGHLCLPARFIDVERLLPLIREGVSSTGRVGLVGAAVSDHPGFSELAGAVIEAGGELSVSSFRAENLDRDSLELLKRGGLKTLTVAIEAGTPRLRRVLGKKIDEEHLLRAAALASEAGIKGLRVYSMVGLPTEEDGDAVELANLAVRARREMTMGEMTLSVAPFVPKPHTPLQWERMADEKTISRRIRLINRHAAQKGVKVAAESPKWARAQGLLSRGSRLESMLLASNPRRSEWTRILKSQRTAWVLDRERPLDERLPWDFLTNTVAKAFLIKQRAEALGAR